MTILAICLFSTSLCIAKPLTSGTKEAFTKIRTERVAVIGIGDSNQRFGGHGWSYYMAKNLKQTFGCWGTELKWMKSTKEEIAKYGPTPKAFTNSFSGWYIPANEQSIVNWQHGQLYITSNSLLNVTGPLLFNIQYGTFLDGNGFFQPKVRKDQPPWTILASHPPTATATGKIKLHETSISLPADQNRNTPLMFSATTANKNITGPFFATCLQAENPQKTTGLAYSTLYAAGGQSLLDMLNTFKNIMGPEKCKNYFQQIRRPLNGSKSCIIMISSGLNDRNEKSKSIGPKGNLPSSSPEGFRDNLTGIVNTLKTAWIQAGGNSETIFFAFMPSHAVGEPDDAKLLDYRAKVVDLANQLPNAGCILLPELVPYHDMVEKKYYDKGSVSNPHLSREGYQALSEAVVNALSQ
jgi:hypothetical protein